jgi:hypothetical protein
VACGFMCTLSFMTRDSGYLLAMNRDEKLERYAGELPESRMLHGVSVIYPSDGASGTWISVNSFGITFALLNSNAVLGRGLDGTGMRSRGQIIPTLGPSSSMAEAQKAAGMLDMEKTLPFRLVGVFPSEKMIGEWRWDSAQLQVQAHGWELRHWFSSSLSDKDAEKLRGTVCRHAQHESDAGSIGWLRRLHASHAGGSGPFSLCVHRQDAATLSYGEVTCTPELVQMTHMRCSPCKNVELNAIKIRRKHCIDAEASIASNLTI